MIKSELIFENRYKSNKTPPQSVERFCPFYSAEKASVDLMKDDWYYSIGLIDASLSPETLAVTFCPTPIPSSNFGSALNS